MAYMQKMVSLDNFIVIYIYIFTGTFINLGNLGSIQNKS